MAVTPVGQVIVDSDAVPAGDTTVNLLRILSKHTARLSAPALEGTASLLLELADKAQPDGDDRLTIGLPLSQGQLGELLGLSAVHMNRTLKQLAKMDLVHHAKGLYTIMSRRRLAEVTSEAH